MTAQMADSIPDLNRPRWVYNPGEAGWLLAHGLPGDPTVIVAGTPDRPAPELCDVAKAALEGQEALRQRLARALVSEPVEVRGDGSASVVVHESLPCVELVQIEFRTPSRPKLANVFVTTGHPSPYHLYEAQVDDGSVLTVRGGFW